MSWIVGMGEGVIVDCGLWILEGLVQHLREGGLFPRSRLSGKPGKSFSTFGKNKVQVATRLQPHDQKNRYAIGCSPWLSI